MFGGIFAGPATLEKADELEKKVEERWTKLGNGEIAREAKESAEEAINNMTESLADGSLVRDCVAQFNRETIAMQRAAQKMKKRAKNNIAAAKSRDKKKRRLQQAQQRPILPLENGQLAIDDAADTEEDAASSDADDEADVN